METIPSLIGPTSPVTEHESNNTSIGPTVDRQVQPVVLKLPDTKAAVRVAHSDHRSLSRTTSTPYDGVC